MTTDTEEHQSKKIKVKEGLTEQQELSLLYKNASTLFLKNDPEAKLLFRGVVHECDNMLKKSSDLNEFKTEFYIQYANALYILSLLETSENKGFLDLSLEMIEKGKSESFFYYYSLARILIKSSKFTEFKECIESLKPLIKQTEEKTVVDQLAEEEEFYEPTHTDMFIELLHYAHSHLETADDVELVRWNIKNWEFIADSGVDALIGIGNEYLFLFDLTTGDEEAEPTQEQVQEAESMLKKCI